MLRRSEGTTLDQMCTASGWQAHSVRGFLSGTVRKKLGLTLETATGDHGRTYRIVGAAAAAGGAASAKTDEAAS